MDLARVLIKATFAGMMVVRRHQLSSTLLEPELKANGTFLTTADQESGKAIYQVLNRLPLEYAIKAEDTAGREHSNPPYRILSDGVDGTAGLVVAMATSTIINACFDLPTQQVTACAIGYPAYDCVWFADKTSGVTIWTMDQKEVLVQNRMPCQVWDGDLGKKATLFLDVSRGFKRGEKQILTDPQNTALFGKMSRLARVLMPGSNGLMHALTANGGRGVCGGITTAMDPKGGWDAAGGFLVKQAGGCLKAYSFKTGTPEEVDPLDVEGLDVLIFANNGNTLEKLNETFLSLF